MRSVPVYQLKNEFSRFLQEVEAGEELSITRRGAEVARLVPSAVAKRSGRADQVREARKAFAKIKAFDIAEVNRAGRKW